MAIHLFFSILAQSGVVFVVVFVLVVAVVVEVVSVMFIENDNSCGSASSVTMLPPKEENDN